jgi:hypothetical protein
MRTSRMAPTASSVHVRLGGGGRGTNGSDAIGLNNDRGVVLHGTGIVSRDNGVMVNRHLHGGYHSSAWPP